MIGTSLARSARSAYCDQAQKRPHHWVIDQPNGPSSTGTCRRCKRTREFPNSSIPEKSWITEKRTAGAYVNRSPVKL